MDRKSLAALNEAARATKASSWSVSVTGIGSRCGTHARGTNAGLAFIALAAGAAD